MKKSITDISVKGKRCLVRVDFNVPLDKNGNVTDDSRIVAALPTITYLYEHGAKVILCSHLGRPKGAFKPEFSLKPVAKRLEELTKRKVIFASDVAGEITEREVSSMHDGDILLMENLRFTKDEEANAPQFCRRLASFADIYVNDAFGTAHRAHASTAGVAAYVKDAVGGFLIEKELRFLGGALEKPDRPFVAVLGGAKVSDKIGVIENLIDKVDSLLIGGGMAYTFLKAEGQSIGKSLCEEEKIQLAKDLMTKARERGVKLLVPVDNVAAYSIEKGEHKVFSGNIPDDMMGVDIGPKTAEIFSAELSKARTVVWNGPMGVFENPDYAQGTFKVARAIADSDAVSIVGGGDSVAAVSLSGIRDKITHISTGGGASLEYLEGKVLPGIDCLNEKEDSDEK